MHTDMHIGGVSVKVRPVPVLKTPKTRQWPSFNHLSFPPALCPWKTLERSSAGWKTALQPTSLKPFCKQIFTQYEKGNTVYHGFRCCVQTVYMWARVCFHFGINITTKRQQLFQTNSTHTHKISCVFISKCKQSSYLQTKGWCNLYASTHTHMCQHECEPKVPTI